MLNTKNKHKKTDSFNLPNDWDFVSMNELGSTYTGLSGKTKEDFTGGNKKFVSYMRIFRNPIMKNQDFELVSISEKEKQNEILYGDCLFTTSSETPEEVAISSVFLVKNEEPHYLNSFSFGYRFNYLEAIDPKFYGYYFRGSFFRKATFKLAQGSTRYNISKNKLTEIKIHIPPLKEQQKIAEILSTVDEQIEQTNELIKRAQLLKRGLIQQLITKGIGHTKFKKSELGEIPVDWEIKKLGDVSTFTNGQAHEKVVSKDGKYILVNAKFISTAGNVYKKVSDNLSPLELDSITMVMSDLPNGKALGKCFLIDEENKYTLNQRICSINAVNINSKFLYYQLNRNKYYLKFDNKVGQTNLKKSDVLNCPILIPSYQEQQKIAEILSSMDQDIEGYEEEKERYKELKKGLMQQLLTGKTRVKVD